MRPDDHTPTLRLGPAALQTHHDDSAYGVGDTLLGRYTIFGIRQGGFGMVLFVNDPAGGQFAVKTYRPQSAEWRPDVEEFRSEAAFWMKLEPHPNIVRAYSVEVIGDQPFLFLEYIDGGARTTLREWLGAGPIAEEQALTWAHAFCVGMEFANARGEIAHLDLKPENLLIARDGTLKITDFGLVQRIRLTDGRYPRATAGTWPYAAPELFAGKPAGTRSDIYAFGVIFYEMLTGRLPYPFTLAATNQERYRQLEAFHARDGAHKLAGDLYWGKANDFTPSEQIGALLNGCLDSLDRVRSFSQLRRLMERLFPQLQKAEQAGSTPEQTLYDQAIALHRLGRFSEALRIYNRLLQSQPDTGRFWVSAAETLAATGDIDGARDLLKTALARDPRLENARRLIETL